MRNIVLFVVILTSTFCLGQKDQDFKYLAKDNDGENIYITSPEIIDNYLKFWVSHIIPIRPDKNVELKNRYVGGNREVILVEIKCLERIYKVTNVITYDMKGQIEKTETRQMLDEKIYSQSFMDIIASEVCK